MSTDSVQVFEIFVPVLDDGDRDARRCLDVPDDDEALAVFAHVERRSEIDASVEIDVDVIAVEKAELVFRPGARRLRPQGPTSTYCR